MALLAVGIDPTDARAGARVVKREMADIYREAEKVERGTGRMGRTANDNFRKMARGTDNVRAGFSRLTAMLPALGAAIGAAFSIRPVFAFHDALAEVSTLVDTATFDMQGLAEAALDQSAAFGGSAASQAKAFYQIISAGAGTAAEATDILTAANRLAVGGVTDVTTAADGLTSVMNAYGARVEGATAVSDALFVGMRAGKTTIGELSSSLGKVAPLAAQTGVSFDELVASISALTKGGISTTEAVTGVRAILAAVAKPTKEASDMAKRLGIDFTSAGLQSKGFAGFLEDLVKRSHGSTEALAQLFGGVEALVPAMALSGQAGRDFYDILDQMEDKAGQTEIAFNKMAASPGFQAGRIWSSLQAEVLKAGNALGSVLAPALKLVADNMATVADLIKIAGAALLAYFAPAILAGVATGFVAIGTAGVAAIRAITIAMAANPIGLIVTALAAALTAAYVFRDSMNDIFGTDVAAAVKTGANVVIGSFVAAWEDIKFVWNQFPNIIGAAAIGAANAAISGIEKMINGAVELLNSFISQVNSALSMLPGGFSIGSVENVSFGQIDNPYSSDLSAAVGARNTAVDAALSYDYIGDLGGVTEASRTAADATRDLNNALSDINVNLDDLAGGKGGGKLDKQAESYERIVQGAEQFIAQQEMERQAIGLTAEEAARLRYEQELLNKAANDNIELTPKQAENLRVLAGEMAAAEAQTNSLREAWDTIKDTARGFVQELKSGLEQGKSFFKAFTDAAISALDKLVDKLLDELLDAIFQVGRAAGGLGGGGLFGGLIGGLASILGFANGGVFQSGHLTAFANGGIVSRPTVFPMARGMGLMGEDGPEAIMPLKRAANGRLGVEASGGSAGSMRVAVDVGVSVDRNGNLQAYVRNVAEETSAKTVRQGLQEYDRAALPARVLEIQQRPRMR